MHLKFVGAIALTTTLLFTGCATSGTSAQAQATATKPSDAVASLIAKHKLEVVDFKYARSKPKLFKKRSPSLYRERLIGISQWAYHHLWERIVSLRWYCQWSVYALEGILESYPQYLFELNTCSIEVFCTIGEYLFFELDIIIILQVGTHTCL